MDTPSPKPLSWDQLTQRARSAAAPADIDVRAAIRAEIAAVRVQPQDVSVLDDVLSLCHSRWLQMGFAALALMAVLSCLESLDVMNEIAWIWQLQGPVLADI